MPLDIWEPVWIALINLLAHEEKSPSQQLYDRVWHLSDTKTFNALLDRIEVVVTRF